MAQNKNTTQSIVLIVAHDGFRDEEYAEPLEIFKENGYSVKTASSSPTNATGNFGLQAKVDLLVKNINVKEFAAIVFVGGPGAAEYFTDRQAHNVIKDAYKNNIIVAAICIAPNILANAGILEGKKATCWDSENLIKRKVNYTGNSVERDGLIITGKNPQAAKSFAQLIVTAIKGNEILQNVNLE